MCAASLPSIFQVCKRVWNTILHQFIAVLAIYVIWVPIQNYDNPFSWHVILSTLGLIPFMVEGLLLFSNDNTWSQDILRKHKYWIHGALMFIGSFLLITGIALEIDRKERAKVDYPEITHFTSEHAITGLICLIFIVLSLACGPLAFTSAALRKFAPSVWFKLGHNILGQFGYFMGIICLILGYYISYFEYYTSLGSRILATIVTIIVTLWSFISSWKSLYNQVKSVAN